MSIEAQSAVVYYAPTARRRYFTKWGAASAEAKAQLRRKYPTQAEDETGDYWHWTDDPRLLEAFRRLRLRLSRSTKAVRHD